MMYKREMCLCAVVVVVVVRQYCYNFVLCMSL